MNATARYISSSLVLVLLFSVPALAAQSAALWLKANGEDIRGESPVMSPGREGTIEVLSLTMGVTSPRDVATGMATGRRTYDPIVITKRIDKSSPLLAKALTHNEVVEGTIRFYRTKPDGTMSNYYTLRFSNGRVSSVRQYLPNVLDPATASLPPYEEVSFVFQTITWIYEDGGIAYEDSMSGRSLSSTTSGEATTQPAPTAPRTITRGIAKPQ